MPVLTGLEYLLNHPIKSIQKKRLGLLSNPASIDSRFRHARFGIAERFAGRLVALFSPQHGFFADKQDNMIESENIIDPILKIPVFSLYSRTRKPDKAMFDLIDTLIIDLQDVGTRVYTFIYTMSYCMEAARQFDKEIIVLDRPNPINGHALEGNILSDSFASFVGRYPIPMRHGMTIGELAMLFNDHFDIGCRLTVIPMKGWKRDMNFTDTGLFWIPPSPNLPTPASAAVYPGQVLWEGTNVSEGRGTTLPFEQFGAPYIVSDDVINSLDMDAIPGVVLRPVVFEPTSNKWKRRICGGFQLHITDPDAYRPYEISLRLLSCIYDLYIDRFNWKEPPYEYEYTKLPIDLITGDENIRLHIESRGDMNELFLSWQKDLKHFDTLRRSYLIYREYLNQPSF